MQKVFHRIGDLEAAQSIPRLSAPAVAHGDPQASPDSLERVDENSHLATWVTFQLDGLDMGRDLSQKASLGFGVLMWKDGSEKLDGGVDDACRR